MLPPCCPLPTLLPECTPPDVPLYTLAFSGIHRCNSSPARTWAKKDRHILVFTFLSTCISVDCPRKLCCKCTKMPLVTQIRLFWPGGTCAEVSRGICHIVFGSPHTLPTLPSSHGRHVHTMGIVYMGGFHIDNEGSDSSISPSLLF